MAERGRPTKRSPAVDKKIIDGLSEGTPLARLCREEGMPAPRTVRDWQTIDLDFAAAIARAREDGFDAIAAEILEIADDARNDWMERKRQDGNTETVLDHEHVQRSKLRIESRLKLLAKWDPKRYGDMVKLADADGGSLSLAAAIAAGNARANGEQAD